MNENNSFSLSSVRILAIFGGMKLGRIVAIVSVFAIALVVSCVFRSSDKKGVMSYRDGKVYLQKGVYYRVGVLPEGWERIRTAKSAVSWYNSRYKSSISTDAFCAASFEGRGVEALGGELISALSARTVQRDERFDLNGHPAVRQTATGSVKGVQMTVDVVVLRLKECVFDMYLVRPPNDRGADADFETFFNGFGYGK